MAIEHASRESLAALVGPDAVRPATGEDAIDGVRPQLVVEPATYDEAAAVLAHADRNGLCVAPRGGGTRIGWGNVPARIDLLLSTRRLDRLIEHADGDMTATMQAGITLRDLNDKLAERGQMLPLDVALADQATIGGLIATNDSGPLRLRYGGIRDLLIGVTIVRADGVIAKGGGKVVKNVAGYDVPKLMTGSLGTLGLIAEATFRLYPLPAESATLRIEAETPEAAGTLVLDVLGSTLVPTGLAIRWSPTEGSRLFLRLAGIPPSVAAQAEQARGIASARNLEARTLSGDDARATWDGLAAEPWAYGHDAVVARCSVLPSEVPALIRALEAVAERAGLDSLALVQGYGLGLIGLAGRGAPASDDALIGATAELRERIAPRGGTLVLLAAPLGVKQRVDVWGPPTDALPVMRQVKARFDPNGTLNPGRFLGERS